MMKYAGTRVASKKRKKTSTSVDKKLPRQADSRSSSQTVKLLSCSRSPVPSSAMGKSSADITTRNNEMPSTPSDHEMPSGATQGCTEVICRPPTPLWNSPKTTAESASTARVVTIPIERTAVVTDFGTSSSKKAAPAGSNTRTVRNGKARCADDDAATQKIAASSLWPISALRPDQEVRDQNDGPADDAECVVPDVTGLNLAQAAADRAHDASYAAHRTVDHLGVDDGRAERGERGARTGDEAVIRGVDVPGMEEKARLELWSIDRVAPQEVRGNDPRKRQHGLDERERPHFSRGVVRIKERRADHRREPALQEHQVRMDREVEDPSEERGDRQHHEGDRHHSSGLVRVQPTSPFVPTMTRIDQLRVRLRPPLGAVKDEEVLTAYVVGGHHRGQRTYCPERGRH